MSDLQQLQVGFEACVEATDFIEEFRDLLIRALFPPEAQEHRLHLGENGFTTEHSITCRIERAGKLHECPIHIRVLRDVPIIMTQPGNTLVIPSSHRVTLVHDELTIEEISDAT